MKRIITTLVSIIVSSWCITSFAQSANYDQCANGKGSLLWKVTSENSTVYLFGTLHLGKAEFFPLAKEVEEAFRNADNLVFEVDPNAALDPQFAMKLQQRGMLGPDENLSDQLSPATLARLQATLTAQGLPAEQLMRLRPWFLTLLLTSQQMLAMGYQPQYGAEMYLMGNKSADTDILELESADEQLEFLTALDNEAYLAYTLDNMEQGKALMDNMAKAWACADTNELTKLLIDSMEMDGVDQQQLEELKTLFFTDRNRKMADKIEEYLKTGDGSYFVAVGAAHYLGDDDIVDFLEAKNYKVESISYK